MSPINYTIAEGSHNSIELNNGWIVFVVVFIRLNSALYSGDVINALALPSLLSNPNLIWYQLSQHKDITFHCINNCIPHFCNWNGFICSLISCKYLSLVNSRVGLFQQRQCVVWKSYLGSPGEGQNPGWGEFRSRGMWYVHCLPCSFVHT